jgi:molecular chaperone DnaK
VSILEISEGVFEVRSTNGDTYLGGEDWDQRLVDHMISVFKDQSGIDVRKDAMALQRIKEAAERAKHELSSCEETDISLPFIARTKRARSTSRSRSRAASSRSSPRTSSSGWSSRARSRSRTRALDAGDRARRARRRHDAHARDPAQGREIFGKAPHKGVNPDEVVAAGAAIQAGVLSGEVQEVLLLDVTPLTLGVETQGGVATPMIPRNTTVPTSMSQVFSTTEDSQTVVRIHVVQGEREMARTTRRSAASSWSGCRRARAACRRSR